MSLRRGVENFSERQTYSLQAGLSRCSQGSPAGNRGRRLVAGKKIQVWLFLELPCIGTGHSGQLVVS